GIKIMIHLYASSYKIPPVPVYHFCDQSSLDRQERQLQSGQLY
ncbi:MAG: hypothetical protein ACI9MF_000878, partial [Gammaproteobacteria bacterium]